MAIMAQLGEAVVKQYPEKLHEGERISALTSAVQP